MPSKNVDREESESMQCSQTPKEQSQSESSKGPFNMSNGRVDFKELAEKDSDFQKIWQKSSGRLNFQDPDTCQALTKAILRVSFGLCLDLPPDRLCPPVPIRWEYVRWIQALVDSTSPNYTAEYDPERKVLGLDIGTGASAIYAMLLMQSRPNWNMCVTEIDVKSFAFAERNLALNGLLHRTTLLQTSNEMPIIPVDSLGGQLDFTSCNPPFFQNEDEMQTSLTGEGKSASPSAVCTGATTEMVYPGGDYGFVAKMVEESLLLQNKVTWYSSMLGKKSSAQAIISLLKNQGVSNWAVGSIGPGTTKRWVVAWSFGDFRPRNDIARMADADHGWLPFPTEYKIGLAEDARVQDTIERLTSRLSTLDLRLWTSEEGCALGMAAENVWNRAYRRNLRKAQASGGKATSFKDMPEMPVKLAFRIKVVEEPNKEFIIDWLRGTDQELWESFCGMVRRTVNEGL